MLNLLRSFFPVKRPSSIMEPLITVLGATGTGKSKLAVDLASRFNGEIINGDAMQMYRGLPVITNQIPIEERNGIPHHLISCIEIEEDPWHVGLFKNECLRLIADIRSRGKLPILVGGTHYYTQAVLLKDQLVKTNSDEEQDVEDGPSTKWPILDAPPDVVLQKLKEVDPAMANRWHPNDTRKIRRSLAIYYQTGKPASEIYAEQKRLRQAAMTDVSCSTGSGQLRFPTMIFWAHSDKRTLQYRLDKRVDDMIEHGLLAEARRMFDYLQEKKLQGISIDHSKGVWVAIGFKELVPYFEALNDVSADEEKLESLKRSCIESIKTATRQYSVSQIKWIRNKLWGALAETGRAHCLYVLDTTNVDDWANSVTGPSERLVNFFLKNEPTPDPKSLSELAKITLDAREAQSSSPVAKCMTCDVCHKTMTNEDQWRVHMNGQAHRRALKYAAKRAEREKYLQKQADSLNERQNKDYTSTEEQGPQISP